MTIIEISNPITHANPFVQAVTDALTDRFLNPHPEVVYDYDGNEVQIDWEYFTLESDVQAYLEDIKRQMDTKPISEVSVQTKHIVIIDAEDRDENEDLSPGDDDYHYNGIIKFD